MHYEHLCVCVNTYFNVLFFCPSFSSVNQEPSKQTNKARVKVNIPFWQFPSFWTFSLVKQDMLSPIYLRAQSYFQNLQETLIAWLWSLISEFSMGNTNNYSYPVQLEITWKSYRTKRRTAFSASLSGNVKSPLGNRPSDRKEERERTSLVCSGLVGGSSFWWTRDWM